MNRADVDVPSRSRTGIEALSLLSKKWHPVVVLVLSHHGSQRFTELQDAIPAVSGKVLSESLDALQEAGLVERREVTESPPRVEYDLTDAGRDLQPVFEALADWGERHLDTAAPRVLLADADRRLTALYADWVDGRFAVLRAHDDDELGAAFDDDVEVVLLDDRLPGTDVRRFVADLDADCRSIVLVGDRPDFDLLSVGCDDVLRKPLVRETAIEAIDRQLARHGESAAQRERHSLRARLSLFESVYPAERLAATAAYGDCRDRLERLAVTDPD